MPLYRNFIYWLDKRNWKYYFLLAALAMATITVYMETTLLLFVPAFVLKSINVV